MSSGGETMVNPICPDCTVHETERLPSTRQPADGCTRLHVFSLVESLLLSGACRMNERSKGSTTRESRNDYDVLPLDRPALLHASS